MLTSSSQPILYRELERSELQSYYQEGKLMRNEGERKEKLPENCVKILSLIMIRIQNMEEVSSKLPLKNFLVKIVSTVLVISKYLRFLSPLSQALSDDGPLAFLKKLTAHNAVF